MSALPPVAVTVDRPPSLPRRVLALLVAPETFSEPLVLSDYVGSIFCFATATLGRLGWAGQSFKGDTSVEEMDQRLFHSSVPDRNVLGRSGHVVKSLPPMEKRLS